MNNQSRFYLKNSWLIYTFICLLSGFILFGPMLIAIFSDSNSVSNIAFSPKNNLSITIVIMITSVFVTLIYSFFQYKNFNYSYPVKIWYKNFFINIFVLIFQCLISFIIFMIIWLVPINIHADDVNKVVSELRITLYAILGSTITFIFLLITLFLNLYIKYRILYSMKKEKDDTRTI